ncbi:MAG: hypothetical protein CL912_01725 [Deltaproteobacteria bacterium]|nr:hypothetical protein [Deltaproteobacteria bacterium]
MLPITATDLRTSTDEFQSADCQHAARSISGTCGILPSFATGGYKYTATGAAYPNLTERS